MCGKRVEAHSGIDKQTRYSGEANIPGCKLHPDRRGFLLVVAHEALDEKQLRESTFERFMGACAQRLIRP